MRKTDMAKSGLRQTARASSLCPVLGVEHPSSNVTSSSLVYSADSQRNIDLAANLLPLDGVRQARNWRSLYQRRTSIKGKESKDGSA